MKEAEPPDTVANIIHTTISRGSSASNILPHETADSSNLQSHELGNKKSNNYSHHQPSSTSRHENIPPITHNAPSSRDAPFFALPASVHQDGMHLPTPVLVSPSLPWPPRRNTRPEDGHGLSYSKRCCCGGGGGCRKGGPATKQSRLVVD